MGQLKYYERSGGTSAPKFTLITAVDGSPTPSPVNGIRYGQNTVNGGSVSHPYFTDVDADGDVDLVMAGREGQHSVPVWWRRSTTAAGAAKYTKVDGAAPDNPFQASAEGDEGGSVGARERRDRVGGGRGQRYRASGKATDGEAAQRERALRVQTAIARPRTPRAHTRHTGNSSVSFAIPQP